MDRQETPVGRRPASWLLASRILLAGAQPTPDAANGALRVGDPMPSLEAESLDDRSVALPQDIRSKAAILVFTFTRKAGKPAAAWGKALEERLTSRGDVELWRVMMLEDVPRVLRGMVVGSIERGIPQPMHARTLKVFRDSAEWKRRLGLRSVDDPVVVLVDGERRIRRLRSGAYDAAEIADFQKGVEEILAPKPSPPGGLARFGGQALYGAGIAVR